ncbi:hypothetical protein DPMN_103679 [Dreissena polymorpha]|uniref:Uncharacterized protein n=1 Tax=Dreissena polymorpha TaxID=45954 RepID=A0A9D4JZE1_DREPO|nr:hypothetical protein DPMN_103679 [Dreissena polymorpha]
MEPPKGKGREGGHKTPGAVTWMQMLSRWAKHGDTRPETRRQEEASLRPLS